MGLSAVASVNARNNLLFFDFYHQGERCREYTKLTDTAANRRKMESVLKKIEAERLLGTFDYAKWFPGSKNLLKFESPSDADTLLLNAEEGIETPPFKEYAETWFDQVSVAWRRSHRSTVRSTLDLHLIPCFGEVPVGAITKSMALDFRAELATRKGRGGNKTLSNKTINRIMQILRQLMDEAADAHGFANPTLKIKRLKQRKTDVNPFSLDEVRLMIETVRADWRDYLIVRFFTAMRTGEINGLQWKYVDFENRRILIRETIVRGELDYTKTDGSQRDIQMSQPVYDALRRAEKVSRGISRFVFCNKEGEPVCLDNFTTRVWHPLLRHLSLEARRPYQTRHTAATLWLAAGENPEWIARQLGHTSVEMLFKTYSRYIPNLTRNDGSAVEGLLSAAFNGGMVDKELVDA